MEKEVKRVSSKMKAIIVACMIILVCVSLLATGTFALFTDKAIVSNHLKSGKLDATLTRTNLVYTVLENELLVKKTNSQALVLDDTTTADENVFGISDGLSLVVPGSYFEATMLLKNNGNIAFDYNIEILFTEGEDTELAKQVKVTVTDHEENAKSAMLDDASGKIVIEAGEALKSGDANAVTFKVKVEFVNITTDDSNNDAMDQSVKFDLIVNAVQTQLD